MTGVVRREEKGQNLVPAGLKRPQIDSDSLRKCIENDHSLVLLSYIPTIEVCDEQMGSKMGCNTDYLEPECMGLI